MTRHRQMHQLRKNLKKRCMVCGAEPFQRCTEPKAVATQKEWSEFKLLAALSDLKAVDPDHLLVQLIESALLSVEPNPDQASLDFSAESTEEQRY